MPVQKSHISRRGASSVKWMILNWIEWAWDECFPGCDDAPCWEMCDSHMGMGSCFYPMTCEKHQGSHAIWTLQGKVGWHLHVILQPIRFANTYVSIDEMNWQSTLVNIDVINPKLILSALHLNHRQIQLVVGCNPLKTQMMSLTRR